MSDLIRSFVAIELPQDLKFELDKYIHKLRELAPKVKWVKAESLHLTLKFLGNVPAEIVDKSVIKLINLPETMLPFSLTTGHFGSFPSRSKPRVFWLGLYNQVEGQLERLHLWVDESMQALGFEKESRKFKPHLTLGRVKVREDFAELRDFVEKNPFPAFSFEVNEFVLMRSILSPQGARYRPIHKFSLQ